MHKVIFSIINLLQQNGSKTPPVAIGEACSKPASRRNTKCWGQTFFLGEYHTQVQNSAPMRLALDRRARGSKLLCPHTMLRLAALRGDAHSVCPTLVKPVKTARV